MKKATLVSILFFPFFLSRNSLIKTVIPTCPVQLKSKNSSVLISSGSTSLCEAEFQRKFCALESTCHYRRRFHKIKSGLEKIKWRLS